MKSHYHVFSGLSGGYLPNTSEMHTTKRSAQQSAAQMADSLRFDDIEVSGSAKLGWYDVRNGREYIEITECIDDCVQSDFEF